MSRIRANNIVNGAGTGAPTFPNGAIINGISTITANVQLNTSELTIGTGTTIGNPSDNVFRILTNGSERVRVNSSGDVGIGTDVPSGKLNVVGSDSNLLNLVQDSGDLAIRLNDRGTGSAYIKVPDNTSGSLTFETGGSERLRVTSGGDVQIANGNLVFSTAGTGIDFSATTDGSGTATSEVLDDYEEGTWTPTLGQGTGAFNSSTTWGRYTKIGHRIWLSCYVAVSSIDNQEVNFEISGHPYTPMDPGTGGFVGSVMTQNSQWGDSTKTSVVTYITDTTDGIRLYGLQNNSTWLILHNIDVNANDSFYITMSYLV